MLRPMRTRLLWPSFLPADLKGRHYRNHPKQITPRKLENRDFIPNIFVGLVVLDIGNDFHVCVRMGGKAAVGLNRVVVPNSQAAPPHALSIMIVGERKMVLGIQPAMIGTTEILERSKFNHLKFLFRLQPVVLEIRRQPDYGNRNDRNSSVPVFAL